MLKVVVRTLQYWLAPERVPSSMPPLDERAYVNLTPEEEADLDRRMELYFSTELDMFPYVEKAEQTPWKWLGAAKPRRFFDFYRRTIEERFPDDQVVRDAVGNFVDRYTRDLMVYLILKTLLLAGALFGVQMSLQWGLGGSPFAALPGWAVLFGGLTLTALAFVALGQVFAWFYRMRLVGESGKLSRLILARTQELHKTYITVRALPDQLETAYIQGDEWGRKSFLLIRILMWIGARVEYLEKYVQIEMWRLMRERFWVGLGAMFVTLAQVTLHALFWMRTPIPAAAETWALAYHVAGAVLFAVFGLWSFLSWRPPLALVKRELTPEAWIRFGDLDVDGSLGDQVRRDKGRLIEYRTLYKG